MILDLVKTCCVSTIMYSLEALNLNATTLRSLDVPLYKAVGKIFKSYDVQNCNWCMFYLNSWPLKYEFYYRKIKFLTKLKSSCNIVLTTLYNINGRCEVTNACDDMHISHASLKLCSLKSSMWRQFELHLID